MNNSTKRKDFFYGIKKGFPICLGYFPVSFTFGLTAVDIGIKPFYAVLMSLTNLTSAGQFAGMQLIADSAAYFEIAITIFIINLRYTLMSLSLSQKIKKDIPFVHKLIFSFGITDEIFAVTTTEKEKLSSYYMFGVILTPIIGWTTGTLFGAIASNLLSENIRTLMGIVLYSMFIAIIIPPATKSKPILLCILISIVFSSILKYISFFSFISSGFKIIISTILASAICAALFPAKETKNVYTD